VNEFASNVDRGVPGGYFPGVQAPDDDGRAAGDEQMSLICSDKVNVSQFFDEWDRSTSGLSLVSLGKKNGVAVDFRSAERLSHNRTMSYASESQQQRVTGN
jgi:hypothetical protein